MNVRLLPYTYRGGLRRAARAIFARFTVTHHCACVCKHDTKSASTVECNKLWNTWYQLRSTSTPSSLHFAFHCCARWLGSLSTGTKRACWCFAQPASTHSGACGLAPPLNPPHDRKSISHLGRCWHSLLRPLGGPLGR